MLVCTVSRPAFLVKRTFVRDLPARGRRGRHGRTRIHEPSAEPRIAPLGKRGGALKEDIHRLGRRERRIGGEDEGNGSGDVGRRERSPRVPGGATSGEEEATSCPGAATATSGPHELNGARPSVASVADTASTVGYLPGYRTSGFASFPAIPTTTTPWAAA